MAGLTAGLISADSDISSGISTTSALAKHSNTFANTGAALLVAGGGGLYFIGRWKGDDHAKEAGILAGEAAIDSFVVGEVVKIATQRERPTDGNGKGRFWQGGTLDSSFPSDHAIAAWSIASVLAHEYPGPLTDVLAYGLATGVSVARVTGKQHFASDVLVGSTIGWLIGRQVYAKHHQESFRERAQLEISPIVDQRTHAYGVHIDVAPIVAVHPVRTWQNSFSANEFRFNHRRTSTHLSTNFQTKVD
jgi:membrane-associated phospholipid phosphatase